MRLLPKYFDNLHLVVNSISGDVSIAVTKPNENGFGCSDKQKKVTEEFYNCLLVCSDKLPINEFKFSNVEMKDNRNIGYILFNSEYKDLSEMLRKMADRIDESKKEDKIG